MRGRRSDQLNRCGKGGGSRTCEAGLTNTDGVSLKVYFLYFKENYTLKRLY